MDLINRYVYAVTKGLPEKQRGDIEKELRTLIDDMIEQNNEPEAYEDKVKKVLLELGDPAELTDNYRGSKRYLIGPQYYEGYLLILKIVLGAVFAGVSIAVFVSGFFSTPTNIVDIISDYLATLFSGLLQAFAWTTLAFVIAERNSMNIAENKSGKNKWKLSELPEIPDKKATIPLSDPISSIIFTTIFIALLYSAPELFAAYIDNNTGTAIIPVFNLEVIRGYRALLVCIFIVSMIKDVLKFFFRRWTLKLSTMLVILSSVSTILILVMFTNDNIWNPVFSNEIINHMNLTFDFVSLWEKLKTGFIIGIILVGVIDILAMLYKGIRYNTIKL